MSLITAAHSPPLSASADISVYDACQKMVERNVGAIAIVSDENTPIGILTERDIIHKVLAKKLDPATTKLSQVMTSPCLAIPSDRSIDDALAVMLSKTVHHLALIDEERKLIGMVSYRTLLGERIDSLNAEVDHLSAYMGDDGIGGG